MDMYRVTVFFNGTKDQLTMLLDAGDEARVRLAVSEQESVGGIKRHGFIQGNETGITVVLNGKNVDYMTTEKFVPPQY